MIISDKSKKTIAAIKDIELKNALLRGDASAITQLGIISQKGIPPKEIIDSLGSFNFMPFAFICSKRKYV